jgi:hypothetical protein
MATVVELAQPLKVGSGLHPCPDTVRVTYARVVHFKPLKVYAILEAELNVRVMQLHLPGALAEVVAVRADGADSGGPRLAVVGVEVLVVGIARTRRMRRIEQGVLVRDGLLVSRNIDHKKTPALSPRIRAGVFGVLGLDDGLDISLARQSVLPLVQELSDRSGSP